MDNTLMELLNRERVLGMMLQEEESLHSLLTARISEALEEDMKHDFYHHYEDLGKVKVEIGDIAIITGYTMPDWLKTKAEEVKEAKENG